MKRRFEALRHQPPIVRCLYCVVTMIALLAGCGPESPGSPSAPSDNAGESPQAWQDRAPTESWMALYIGESKVGYARNSERFFVEDGRDQVETKHEESMSLRRAGQATTTHTMQRCVETRDGRLVQFRSETLVGSEPLIVTGEVKGRSLVTNIESPGRNQQREIQWNPSWGGIFAAQRWLLRKPMKPGERRELMSLFVALDNAVPAEVLLVAGDEEETALLDKTEKLQRIEMTERIEGQEIQSSNWVSPEGEVLKAQIHLPGLEIVAFQTTREKALAESEAADFDLFNAANIRVEQRLERPHQTKQVVYRATLKEGDPQKAFPVTASQSVESIDEHTAKVTVRALRPDSELDPTFDSTPPTEDDLNPNSLLQSDEPQIAAMADTVAPGEKDPWKIALALEKFVDRYITETTMSVAMATAAEVAHTRKGDCTEHAMLLAALCRAREIPARVAVGLVYYPPRDGDGGGFAYHMWTEVWIEDRWIPIDATLGAGGIGAAHLTLAESNLKEGGSIRALLPVLQVISDLQLEILDQQ